MIDYEDPDGDWVLIPVELIIRVVDGTVDEDVIHDLIRFLEEDEEETMH